MNIVVGIDGSPASKSALRFALDDARALDAEVIAVGSWQPAVYPVGGLYGGVTAGDSPDLDPVIHERVQAVIDEVRTAQDPVPTIQTGCGSAALLLMDVAADAEELVVGTRGRGALASAVLGSVSHQLANHAPCPLIVVPGPSAADDDTVDTATVDTATVDTATVDTATAAADTERADVETAEQDAPSASSPATLPNVIVVGVDGSPNAAAALNWALARAARTSAVVRVVHSWEDSYAPWVPTIPTDQFPPRVDLMEHEARASLHRIIAEADVPAGVTVHPLLHEGPSARVLRDVAASAGLLVVGSRGIGGFVGLLLGSVARTCLNHVEVPVAVIPPPADHQ